MSDKNKNPDMNQPNEKKNEGSERTNLNKEIDIPVPEKKNEDITTDEPEKGTQRNEEELHNERQGQKPVYEDINKDKDKGTDMNQKEEKSKKETQENLNKSYNEEEEMTEGTDRKGNGTQKEKDKSPIDANDKEDGVTGKKKEERAKHEVV